MLLVFFSISPSAEQGNYSFTRLKHNVANIFITDSYDPLFILNDSFSELNAILQKLKKCNSEQLPGLKY